MGIDAQAVSRLLPKKFIGRASGREALECVARAAGKWLEEKGFGLLSNVDLASDNKLLIHAVPVADPLIIDLTPAGLVAGFRSSNGGPGYHALLVDLLDALADRLRLSWDWGPPGENSLDETGYAHHRDFRALQTSMANFLAHLADHACELGVDKLALCVPMGLVPAPGEVAAPKGPQETDWLSTVNTADEAELLQHAETFFTLWTRDPGPPFWEGLLRAVLWQEAQWRPPISAREQRVNEIIADLAGRLRAAGGDLPADLRQALEDHDRAIVDEATLSESETGWGYRRRMVWYQPFQNWTLELPGHMVEPDQHDPESAVYLNGRLVLRVGSMTVGKPEGGGDGFAWPDMFDPTPPRTNGNVSWKTVVHAPDETDGSVSSFTLVLHETPEACQLLTMTLSAGDETDLEVLDSWLERLRFMTPEQQSTATFH